VWLAIDEWFVTLPLKVVAVLLTQSTMRSVGRSLERFFVREGILRSAISLGGKSEDVHCFSLTRCEFVAALNQHERLRRLSTTWKAMQ
jgi:hypothetical protein